MSKHNRTRGMRLSVLAALVAVLGGLVLWAALLPGGDSPVRIGVISLTSVDLATFDGFREELQALGYAEGGDLAFIHPQPAGDIARLDALVAGVLAEEPDLILVSSTPATLAVKHATAKHPVPVVFAPVNDPLKAGVVANARRPGGNITGVRLPRGDDLRLQWLRKVAPDAHRILMPFNPHDPSSVESVAQLRRVAPALDAELVEVPVVDAAALDALLQRPPGGVEAIMLPRDSSIEARIDDFVALAEQLRLPLCVPSLVQVEAGALLSYGFVHQDIGRQAAHLAVQILHGVPPGDLPLETALSHLAINLRSARSIGLEVPDSLLRQAQEVLR